MPDAPPFHRWQLSPEQANPMPRPLTLAADSRRVALDLNDDQVWALSLHGEQAAIQLQTRYNGRVGLAALLPMWEVAGRAITSAADYVAPPILTAFAPGYLRVEARLTDAIAVTARFWAMDSHAVGARFTLHNTADAPQTVIVKVAAFVAANDREYTPSFTALPSGSPPPSAARPNPAGTHMLRLGIFGGIAPVVLMQNSTPDAGDLPGLKKLRTSITLEAGAQANVRLVAAALPTLDQSLAHAHATLNENWNAAFADIAALAQAVPVLETGNADWDAAIAFSYHHLLTHLIASATNTAADAPLPFLIARSADGALSERTARVGQTAYLTALAFAPVDAKAAHNVVRSLLVQARGELLPPLLARLAWGVFQYTEDDAFLREIYPALVEHFRRWFSPENDRDGDGVPEWNSDAQIGLYNLPVFTEQGIAPASVESPDLVAYLLSEAISLHEIGYYLREPADSFVNEKQTALAAALETFWQTDQNTYARRDRDTHTAGAGRVLLADGRGGEDLFLAEDLPTPTRLLITLSGGVDHRPDARVHVVGKNAAGEPLSEIGEGSAVRWYAGRGVYTTQAAFSTVDRVQAEGLVRVYRVGVATPDLILQDITALVPLWSPLAAANPPPERIPALTANLESEYLSQNGLRSLPATDATAESDPPARPDPYRSAVYPFFNTLIGEGLIESGQMDAASNLAQRLLNAVTHALKTDGAFYELYPVANEGAESAGGGVRGHIAGIAPLHLLMRVFGVRVISPASVWAGGAFAWPHPFTLRHRGVEVRRSAEETSIQFPSGYTATLAPDAPMQEVRDRGTGGSGAVSPPSSEAAPGEEGSA